MRTLVLSQSIPRRYFNPTGFYVRRFAAQAKPCCATKKEEEQKRVWHQPSLYSKEFWSDGQSWRRASLNTFRCLIGCTLGDFSALFYLQHHYPTLGASIVMPVAMASGISTSILIETLALRFGKDSLSWSDSLRTSLGMSLISMLTMEAVENLVDFHLTGGVIALTDPSFWLCAALSMAAGFVAPLPWNYYQLRRKGKACH